MSKIGPIIYDFNVVNRKKLRLWDHGWLDSVYCHVSGLSVGFMATDIFDALLGHRLYKRGYYGLPPDEDFMVDEHGPFRIDRLKSSNFVEIRFEELTKRIQTRYADPKYFYEPPDTVQIEAVDAFLNQLPKEGTRYFRLAVSHEDPDYHHGTWFIHLIFDEYILLNPQQEAMWIITIGYD